MKSHKIVGGGGTALHLVETGNPNGRQIEIMANAGHAPFWEDAPAFNQSLKAFCRKAAGLSAPPV